MSSINLNNLLYIIFVIIFYSQVASIALFNSSATIFTIIGIYLFFSKKHSLVVIDKSPFIFIFGLFFIFIFLSSLLSNYWNISLRTVVPYLLYFIFTLQVTYLINIDTEKFLRFIFISLIFIFSVLFIFLIYEISQNDLFLGQDNFKSLFSKKVLGIYVVRYFPIIFALIFYFKKSFSRSTSFILLLSICFIAFVMIIASSQRTALFMFIISIILLFMVTNLKKYFFYIFILLLITFTSFNFIYKNSIFDRFYNQTINQITFDSNFYIFSKQHNGHYSTAYKMFLKNPFTGVGPNIFRYECGNSNYITYYDQVLDSSGNYQRHYSCSTHPHNYYIQTLSESGVLPFIILILFYLYLIKQFINNFIKPINHKYLIIYNGSIISLLVIFFPISPSMNFYNTWSNTIIFIIFGIFLYFNNYLKNK